MKNQEFDDLRMIMWWMNKNGKAGSVAACLGLLLLFVIVMMGCSRQEQTIPGKTYQLYYLNDKATKIIPVDYVTQTSDTMQLIEELLEEMRQKPEKTAYVPAIGDGYDIVSYAVSEETITINMDERFREVDPIKSVLVQAALVRSLTQCENIQIISMTINGEALQDGSGNVVGPMKADFFIDNAGEEISPVETVKMTLYFAKEGGKTLEKVNRTLEYNSNISMEKLVVEQIISGPVGDVGLPTVNPDTKIVNVTTKDGICYVNLDDTFLNQIYDVAPEVTVYSIANSLIELSNVNKVQFSINGETNVMYREKMDFSLLYERNLDLVE